MAGGGKDRGELDPHGGEVQGLESTILWEALKDAMLWQNGSRPGWPQSSKSGGLGNCKMLPAMLQRLSMIFLQS
jgi:hypothetical protein